MLARLSSACAAARGSWLAAGSSRGYATQLGKRLVYAEHGTPQRVLQLEQHVLPSELGEHDVLLHLLAVSLCLLWNACLDIAGLPAAVRTSARICRLHAILRMVGCCTHPPLKTAPCTGSHQPV
jgi:hypothetical protein